MGCCVGFKAWDWVGGSFEDFVCSTGWRNCVLVGNC